LLERGLAVIGHTRVHNRQCLKFTCMNPTATEADLETLLSMIIEEGEAQEKK
jgi:glutamate/tyrosine decarboxylase-like PLP-dependent enzyme